MQKKEAIHIQTPVSDDTIKTLQTGQDVLISGTIYTARDAAHKRLAAALAAGEPPPFDFAGAVVFYAGPSPAGPGRAIGAIGPTTSGRMDAYSPALINAGLKVMLGKGDRNAAVCEAITRSGGVYLAAIGGAAALISKRVLAARVIAYPELGAEAIWELTVKNLPATVAIDCAGRNIYSNNA